MRDAAEAVDLVEDSRQKEQGQRRDERRRYQDGNVQNIAMGREEVRESPDGVGGGDGTDE